MLDGTFAPQVLNKTWDVDVRIEGQPAPKKLLLNAVAPYEFTVSNPEGDEELARTYPGWPCCHEPDDKDLSELFHRITWRGSDAGVGLGVGRFTDSISTLRFLRPAWTHPAGFDGLAPLAIVASVEMGQPGVIALADFDEDAALCSIRLAWPRAARVTLVMFDDEDKEVGRRDLGTATSPNFKTFVFGAGGPIRRLEVRAALPSGAAPGTIVNAEGGALVEIDEVAYIGLRDYLDILIAGEACDSGSPGGLEGKGRLALLPNHEYELAFTTRVTVAHPSKPAVSADVQEFVYVRTKGLPGLNAVDAGRRGDRVVRAVGVRGWAWRARVSRGAGGARVLGGLPRRGAVGGAPAGVVVGADDAHADGAARDARPRRGGGQRVHDDGGGLGRRRIAGPGCRRCSTAGSCGTRCSAVGLCARVQCAPPILSRRVWRS